MDLLERYLQSVRYFLPRAQRDDILKELSENIRSQFDDKEAELGRPLTETELAAIIKHHGSPLLAASRYRQAPLRHLIGPGLFPFYWFVLKILLWIGLAVCALSSIALISSGQPVRDLFGGLLGFLHTALPAFGWITFLFAALDFLDAKFHLIEKIDRGWDPLRLPPLKPPQPPPIRRSESVLGVIFGLVFVAWFLVAPYYPYLVFGPAASVLKFTPAWHQFYLPVVLLEFGALAQAVLTLLRPTWTSLSTTARLAINVLGLVIVRAALDFYPYVFVVDRATDVTHYQIAAAIWNVSVLISLVCLAIALFVSALYYTWQCIKELRRFVRTRRTPEPSSIA